MEDAWRNGLQRLSRTFPVDGNVRKHILWWQKKGHNTLGCQPECVAAGATWLQSNLNTLHVATATRKNTQSIWQAVDTIRWLFNLRIKEKTSQPIPLDRKLVSGYKMTWFHPIRTFSWPGVALLHICFTSNSLTHFSNNSPLISLVHYTVRRWDSLSPGAGQRRLRRLNTCKSVCFIKCEFNLQDSF